MDPITSYFSTMHHRHIDNLAILKIKKANISLKKFYTLKVQPQNLNLETINSTFKRHRRTQNTQRV